MPILKNHQIKINLFKNNYKKSDKHPDMVSSFQDSNGKYQTLISVWSKKTKKGDRYLSLTVDFDNLKKYDEFLEKKDKTEREESIDPNDLPF